jgi:hypothetical protein
LVCGGSGKTSWDWEFNPSKLDFLDCLLFLTKREGLFSQWEIGLGMSGGGGLVGVGIFPMGDSYTSGISGFNSSVCAFESGR